MENLDFKRLIFQRYIGEFQQADEQNATYRKTSEQIQLDLMGMASIHINEIALFMVEFGYMIGFEESNPVWLLRDADKKEIEE